MNCSTLLRQKNMKKKSKEYKEKIKTVARQVDGVIDIEKCRIRKSGLHRLIDIQVEVDGDLSVRRGHEIAHLVKDALIASKHGVPMFWCILNLTIWSA